MPVQTTCAQTEALALPWPQSPSGIGRCGPAAAAKQSVPPACAGADATPNANASATRRQQMRRNTGMPEHAHGKSGEATRTTPRPRLMDRHARQVPPFAPAGPAMAQPWPCGARKPSRSPSTLTSRGSPKRARPSGAGDASVRSGWRNPSHDRSIRSGLLRRPWPRRRSSYCALQDRHARPARCGPGRRPVRSGRRGPPAPDPGAVRGALPFARATAGPARFSGRPKSARIGQSGRSSLRHRSASRRSVSAISCNSWIFSSSSAT